MLYVVIVHGARINTTMYNLTSELSHSKTIMHSQENNQQINKKKKEEKGKYKTIKCLKHSHNVY